MIIRQVYTRTAGNWMLGFTYHNAWSHRELILDLGTKSYIYTWGSTKS